LVKKRKKSDEVTTNGDAISGEESAKKPHIEAETTNGNGHTNGI
jgi:hypothetical protein